MIAATVLAAGRSTRMGRSKAFLPFGRSYPVTFLERIVGSLQQAGLQDILVVGRPEDEALARSVERLSGRTQFVPNSHHERGQLTSVVAAVNTVDRPGIRGLLVIPVDMPLVRVETVRRLVDAFAASPGSIVRAAYGGRHGHPVIFDRESFDALRHADPAVGAKSVLQAHASRVVNVEADDEGVLTDVDSLEQYVQAFGAPPESFEASVRS
jgi:CTP:molybdopterin cytidylyltransferase MocA